MGVCNTLSQIPGLALPSVVAAMTPEVRLPHTASRVSGQAVLWHEHNVHIVLDLVCTNSLSFSMFLHRVGESSCIVGLMVSPRTETVCLLELSNVQRGLYRYRLHRLCFRAPSLSGVTCSS